MTDPIYLRQIHFNYAKGCQNSHIVMPQSDLHFSQKMKELPPIVGTGCTTRENNTDGVHPMK